MAREPAPPSFLSEIVPPKLPSCRVEMWPPERCIPYASNARKISEQAVSAVAGSIKEFGFRQPIVVDGDGVIIAGHTRQRAAQLLGMREVPVVVAADLTPDQVKRYRLADNRVAEFTEWDVDLLRLELGTINGDLGFAKFDELDLLGGSAEEAGLPSLGSGDRDKDSIGTITIRLPLDEKDEVLSWLDSIKAKDPSGALLMVCRGGAWQRLRTSTSPRSSPRMRGPSSNGGTIREARRAIPNFISGPSSTGGLSA